MKTSKFVVLIYLYFASHAALAGRFKWEIQITNPQFELNYQTLGDGGFKPFLPKTSWRCYIEPIIEKNMIEMRKMRCNYSIKKTGKVTTLLSCSDQKTYDEVTLELFDEKKKLTFSVMLICRKK